MTSGSSSGCDMASTLNADNGVVSGAAGLKSTGDGSGILALQTNGTTSLSINTSQALGVGSTPSYGTSGQVLTSAGSGAAPTWSAAPVTSPGGSTTQVQFNSSGSFAGSANLTFDGTTLTAAGLAGPAQHILQIALRHQEQRRAQGRAVQAAHAANHHDREDNDDEISTHQRPHLVDRCRQNASKSRKRHAKSISQRDHAWHIDAEGAYQLRVFSRGAQIGTKLRLFDRIPSCKADGEREDYDPSAIIRQEHEA
mgnify:CR=1 FL=1